MSVQTNGTHATNHVTVTLADSGQILPAPGANRRYRIFALVISVLAATNAKFQSAANDVSSTFYLPATGGVVLPHVDLSWFRTNPNEALNLNLSAPTNVSVTVIYDLVDF